MCKCEKTKPRLKVFTFGDAFYTGKRNVLNWSGLKYKRFSIFMLCSSACYSIDVSQNKCEAGKELSTP